MFAENLKKLRKNKGLTQVQFAQIFNISSGTIAMWETNKRIPDTSMLIKIAEFFNVTVDYLLGKDNTSSDEKIKDPAEDDQDLVILNRNAKKLPPENRKLLIDMAKAMLKEEF
ncbi:helix-turn-helix transcriptional regulator, partial [Ruminococcus sp.]|uniref:helix-turn-helix domain-containing protein n=1 Tax=Ruminococcus sp. TaxID=41978 RepID=UPI001B51A581